MGRELGALIGSSRLLALGMTLEDVKQLLGHSSIRLTSNTYGHVLEKRQRQVAQAMYAGDGRSCSRTGRRDDGPTAPLRTCKLITDML